VRIAGLLQTADKGPALVSAVRAEFDVVESMRDSQAG
jgi:hypothetical protein